MRLDEVSLMRNHLLVMPRMQRLVFVRRLLLLVVALLLLAAACGGPGGPEGAVHVLKADGDVNPVMHRYINRGIDQAEDAKAMAVVIELDTPGGLMSSMEDIVKRIEEDRIPVIVYVSPKGAKAASAGTFITMAANIAAMAPSTRIGAASPVGAGGEDIEGTLGKKVTEDAVAYAKSIANYRGRNAEWAEQAVREAVSATETEAVDLNVVDLVADDLPSLLEAVDGREVQLVDRTVALTTREAEIVHNNMNLAERFLDLISDPNITFLLLSLGSIALFYEIVNPGQIFPGVFGAIALIIAFFSLSVLPFNWAGVILIFLAFALFIAEIFVTSGGVLGIGGVVALILGGLLLTWGNPSGFQVNMWLVYGMAAAAGAFFLFVVTSIIRIRSQPAVTGVDILIGRRGVARSPLDPSGMVFVDGEYWSATLEDGSAEEGEEVVVTAIEGLRLIVRKKGKELENG
ncbi:MAG: nodulation protein NfeD [Dehalococcoidia bacterium]|nr:MAG: nodulation protein NfeD [Dehalococcoidia bacterium]